MLLRPVDVTNVIFRRCLTAILTAVFQLALAGCATGFNAPPAAALESPPVLYSRLSRDVIVVGSFDSPGRAPLPRRDVGPGMSESLARTALNQTGLQIRYDPALARQVGSLLRSPMERRNEGLQRIRDGHPEVRFVVLGRVTDFAHTVDLPDAIQRWNLFGRRREAVAAMEMEVVDIRLGRTVAVNHVHGMAGAPETPTEDLYENISFGSFLFWSTPLGKASKQAIERGVSALARGIGPEEGTIRIAAQVGPRELKVEALAKDAMRYGGRFFVYQRAAADLPLSPVIDPATDLPLEAHVRATRGSSSTALLFGQKPLNIDLRGALLRKEDPNRRRSESSSDAESLSAVPEARELPE